MGYRAGGRPRVGARQLQLRAALLQRVLEIGPGRVGEEHTGEITTLATRGVDALDAYFSLYLPQLVLAVIVPFSVVAVVLASDWISAVIIVVTLPLIPVFMALVGASTRDRTAAQLSTLQRLAAHFYDVMSGLPTLKVFGAAKRQVRVIAEVSDRHRVATMSALRLTFLSSLILELLATLSVALVAVAVGLRLMYGDLDLRTAMFVLVVAPEAYLPLRALGANYHASAEGMSAAEQVFSVLAEPEPDGRRSEAAAEIRTRRSPASRSTSSRSNTRGARTPRWTGSRSMSSRERWWRSRAPADAASRAC